MSQIHDHSQLAPLEYVLTDAEREQASFAQAHLRFRARTAPVRNAAREATDRTERAVLNLDTPL